MTAYGESDRHSFNLEYDCDKSGECWDNYRQYSTGEAQMPYIPWIGERYDGLLFLGINFNGGNTDIDYCRHLKEEASERYLARNKYLIFRQPGYRGSPFWYYVALLGLLYQKYAAQSIRYSSESDVDAHMIKNGFRHCVFTNIVKCSTANDGRSIPSDAMYENCSSKLTGELKVLKPKYIFSFTRHTYPDLLNRFERHHGRAKILDEKHRSRITQFDDFFFVEVEHPVSTAIHRGEKFDIYSNMIYRMIDLSRG